MPVESSSLSSSLVAQPTEQSTARWLLSLLDRASLASALKRGGMAVALGLGLQKAIQLQQYLSPTIPTSHPGTAAWRDIIDNPRVPPCDFEHRFIGRAALGDRSWDFIIIGAGSAGCVLARRLCACKGVRVLLIEAGGEAQNAPVVASPQQAMTLWRSEVDWGFRSTPQAHLLPMGRTVNLERGLTLGGSSSINWLMWVHGQKEDFNRWETQMGCGPEWNYESVVPNFSRLERLSKASFGNKTRAANRGEDGPMEISTVHPVLPENINLTQAAQAVLNVPAYDDYNGPDQSGVATNGCQYSVQGASGRRADAFNTFVEPMLREFDNLEVVSEAFVRRIMFNDQKRATGVEIELNNGQKITVGASKEVVLCAGAIGSPHILMHSGVGPQEHLASLGIPLVAHAPAVGQNLQDHVQGGVSAYTKEPMARVQMNSGLSGIAFGTSPEDAKIAVEEGHQRGPDCEFILVSRIPALCGVTGVQDKFCADLQDWGLGDMWTNGSVAWRSMLALSAVVARTDTIVDSLNRLISVGGMLNHIESRGTVSLASADPHTAPLIDPNYLSDQRDVDKLKWMTRQCAQMLAHPSFRDQIESVDWPPTAGGSSLEQQPLQALEQEVDDAELEEYVRKRAKTTWHYSCTLKMGAAEDESCACDPLLHVKGVTGLRCADASVMPFVVSANTNATCMMIGDKSADFIIREHGLTPQTVSKL